MPFETRMPLTVSIAAPGKPADACAAARGWHWTVHTQLAPTFHMALCLQTFHPNTSRLFPAFISCSTVLEGDLVYVYR